MDLISKVFSKPKQGDFQQYGFDNETLIPRLPKTRKSFTMHDLNKPSSSHPVFGRPARLFVISTPPHAQSDLENPDDEPSIQTRHALLTTANNRGISHTWHAQQQRLAPAARSV